MLKDSFGRHIDYLRIGVTDRCNLRCNYCMPIEGINYGPRANLLSFEEIIRAVRILSEEGIRKLRITGGEPFLRKDLMALLKSLSDLPLIEKIAITTNGTFTLKYLDEIEALGIRTINLSIDSIDPVRFETITRTNQFKNVWTSYQTMLSRNFDLKLNCVVLEKHNIKDIIPMVELGRDHNVSIRFIEEMPFNGTGDYHDVLEWDYKKILAHIKSRYPNVELINSPVGSTSINYRVKGFKGSFGIIPAYSRTFCGSCNRIRLTPNGNLKTCLYEKGVFNLRDLMRAGASDAQILDAVKDAIQGKAKDGFESERIAMQQNSFVESMAKIGG